MIIWIMDYVANILVNMGEVTLPPDVLKMKVMVIHLIPMDNPDMLKRYIEDEIGVIPARSEETASAIRFFKRFTGGSQQMLIPPAKNTGDRDISFSAENPTVTDTIEPSSIRIVLTPDMTLPIDKDVSNDQNVLQSEINSNASLPAEDMCDNESESHDMNVPIDEDITNDQNVLKSAIHSTASLPAEDTCDNESESQDMNVSKDKDVSNDQSVLKSAINSTASLPVEDTCDIESESHDMNVPIDEDITNDQNVLKSAIHSTASLPAADTCDNESESHDMNVPIDEDITNDQNVLKSSIHSTASLPAADTCDNESESEDMNVSKDKDVSNDQNVLKSAINSTASLPAADTCDNESESEDMNVSKDKDVSNDQNVLKSAINSTASLPAAYTCDNESESEDMNVSKDKDVSNDQNVLKSAINSTASLPAEDTCDNESESEDMNVSKDKDVSNDQNVLKSAINSTASLPAADTCDNESESQDMNVSKDKDVSNDQSVLKSAINSTASLPAEDTCDNESGINVLGLCSTVKAPQIRNYPSDSSEFIRCGSGLRCAYCYSVIDAKIRLVHLKNCSMLPVDSPLRERELWMHNNKNALKSSKDKEGSFELCYVQAHPYAELTWIKPIHPIRPCPMCGIRIIWNSQCLQFHVDRICQGLSKRECFGDKEHKFLESFVGLGKRCDDADLTVVNSILNQPSSNSLSTKRKSEQSEICTPAVKRRKKKVTTNVKSINPTPSSESITNSFGRGWLTINEAEGTFDDRAFRLIDAATAKEKALASKIEANEKKDENVKKNDKDKNVKKRKQNIKGKMGNKDNNEKEGEEKSLKTSERAKSLEAGKIVSRKSMRLRKKTIYFSDSE
ncbi:unnamed protein product [Orchesella dallaii]|uniref:Uncharacterized protein n=1 Tax=Orchesella dallaii TaxID=48710 RepID=A0ABP1QA00_9HEXA